MEKVNLMVGVNQYPFPEDLANNIIDIIEKTKSVPWEKSGIGDGNETSQEVRTSNGFSFTDFFPFWDAEIKKHFVAAVQDYCQEYDIKVSQDEKLNMLRYENTNKYDYHVDTNWATYRTVSGLIYLNPKDYQGGETHFKYFDVGVKPEKPSIVVFPSNYAYLHAAKPVTEGVKYVLVTWMNDLPEGFHPKIIKVISEFTGRG